ncbi:3-(3-hydroxy-phenyl)propionate transporter MhpT [Acinetobacter qingfengensis]|uniref:3-(3-hydroxy-phenyl)propionate transporter MhpT n=1 Tax=Acinetobacter qingfengensis TaxID=1262585 RepID=A0A1E7R3T6_9GAMM|nr:3-(3-hydroxy-phenyl)propionate transporter MhpT [Acinetobacter qingfengensis]KAA8731485.1 3-(3-hydroxy-phenyl)propionate transporter MhpT [Acinetobacter qingfengensis]OEY93975.1 3-(3-hydroxy-phenyl)propionate transporter MhpT [Acinetobacter qingfengensis]
MESSVNADKKTSPITVFLCFVIAVIEGLDLQAAGIAASGIKEYFSLTPEQLGIFFSTGILGLLPGTLFGGRYADKVGRKKVLIWSVATFAVFTLMTAWVNSFYTLLLVRFLAGVGMGAALPNLITLASEATTENNRGRAVGLMYCGLPVGAILLSFWAAYDPTGSWKSIFYIGGILPLLVIPLMIYLLPESKEYLQAVKNKAEHNIAETSFKDILSGQYIGRTILLWISYFFTLMVVYIMLSWLPSLFMGLGFSRQQGSMAQVFFMIGAFFGTIILGMLIDRWNKVLVIILMYIGILVGLLSLNNASTLTEIYIAATITGTFTIGGQGVLYAYGSFVYPTNLRGTGVGAASAVGRAGAMVGPTVAGFIVASGAGASGVFTAAIPGILLSAIIMVLLSKKLESSKKVEINQQAA